MVAWIPAAVLLLSAPEVEPEVVARGACDDGAALRQRVDALVPSPLPVASVRLEARQVEPVVWEGTLHFEVEGTAHERVMSAESCAALYEASALVISLAVQPMLEQGPETPPPEVVPAPPSESESEREAEAVAEPLRSETESTPSPGADASRPSQDAPPLRVRGRVGAGVAVGLLHPVHATTTLGVDLVGSRWAVALDAHYLPPIADEPATDVQITMQMLAFGARGCAIWRFVDERIAVPLCAGLAAGPAFGRGEGTGLQGRRGRQPWFGVLLGPRLQLHSRWGGDLWLATEVVAPVQRLNFVVGSVGTVCCEQPLGFMMSVGAAFSGPR
ncbi:MAG: hypothetical protein AAF799_06860 [Myxococcota bacterium]